MGRFLKELTDPVLWNSSSEEKQDELIEFVSSSLGSSFIWLSTSVFQCGALKNRLATFRHNETAIEFSLVPYPCGGLLFGRWPVIQSQWDTLPGADRRSCKDPSLPIDGVTYKGILSWLRRVGDGLRLPSEKEWHYGCLAGSAALYPWGDEMDDEFCWYEDNSEESLQPPRLHDGYPNAFGLVDMVGNVSELCATEWKEEGFGDFVKEVSATTLLVHRGGNVHSHLDHCNSFCRVPISMKVPCPCLGFRLVRSLSLCV